MFEKEFEVFSVPKGRMPLTGVAGLDQPGKRFRDDRVKW